MKKFPKLSFALKCKLYGRTWGPKLFTFRSIKCKSNFVLRPISWHILTKLLHKNSQERKQLALRKEASQEAERPKKKKSQDPSGILKYLSSGASLLSDTMDWHWFFGSPLALSSHSSGESVSGASDLHIIIYTLLENKKHAFRFHSSSYPRQRK